MSYMTLLEDVPLVRADAGLLAALALSALWLVREVLGIVLKRSAARMGEVGFVKEDCGFFCLAKTEDGTEIEARYHPERMFLTQRALELKIAGDLYNDSDTPVLLIKPMVRFESPTDTTMTYRNPTIVVNGKKTTTIAVPAHGTAGIVILLTVLRSQLATIYSQTIPFLDVMCVSGRERSFMLSSVSFYGSPIVAWPAVGDRPIVVRGSSDEDVQALIESVSARETKDS